MILDTFVGRYYGAQLEAKSVRKSYSNEFKIKAAEMVLDDGESVPDVCESLGLGRTALRRWVEQLRQEREGQTPVGAKAITPEQQRIQELEALVRQKDRDIEIPKKGQCSPASGLQGSFSLINELSEQFGVFDCCRVLGVRRSSFYAWRKRQGRKDPVREDLRSTMASLFKASRSSAGSRTLVRELRRAGHKAGRYKVRMLMKEAGLQCKQRRPHRYRSSGTEALIASNQLKRNFNVSTVNQVWCGDVTYIQVGKRWLYLAAVIDLYARRVVGWAFSMIADARLACEALRMAVESRGRPAGVMFHSDQGCQYTSHKFRAALEEYGLEQSMSHRGQCWDNAVMERFFGALKSEWMPAEGYETEAQAQLDIQAYLMRYNLKRLHSYNGYETPVAMEKKLKVAA
ncbi:IS3 family transposase [Pseudomonas sp. JV241A]|uniref:IS3 family transposase n=2 Tax=Pseudomonas sp. JV241A TaxID=2078785 RepID=UPI001F02258C|nr:IS3 family transposase [Pseudomonas sp. JV241A]